MTPQTPAPTAQTPTVARPRTTRTPPPVHAGPLALAAANASTIAAATLVHVAGPGALAAAVGAATIGGGAAALRRVRTRRRPSVGRVGRAPRTLGGLTTAGPARAASGGRSLLPRLGTTSARKSGAGPLAGAGRSATRGSTSRPSQVTTPRSAALKRATRATDPQTGPRISDAVRAALRPADGKRPTVRSAASAARRAITPTTPVKRTRVRRFLAGVGAGLAAGTVAGVQRLRKVGSRTVTMSHRPPAKAQAQRTPARVGTTVRRPGGQQPTNPTTTATRKAPQAKPAPVNPDRTPTPAATATHIGGVVSIRQLNAISEDFLAAAARSLPEGMLQVVAEAHKMPEVLENHARAMQIRYQRAQEHPLHPSIVEMYQQVHAAQLAVVKAAAEIGPAIERMHKAELDRLRNPRKGEQMWDVQANRGAA